MSKQNVYGVNESNAILLLEAAQKLDLDPGVVETTTMGHFVVPEEVAKAAGFDEDGRPSKKAAKDAAQTEQDKADEAQAASDALAADAKAAAEAQQANAAESEKVSEAIAKAEAQPAKKAAAKTASAKSNGS